MLIVSLHKEGFCCAEFIFAAGGRAEGGESEQTEDEDGEGVEEFLRFFGGPRWWMGGGAGFRVGERGEPAVFVVPPELGKLARL